MAAGNLALSVKIEIHILHYKTCKLASETCTISVTKQFTAVIKISNYKHTELLEDTLLGGGMIMSSLPGLVSSVTRRLLSKPGDRLIAEITPTGKEVIKLITKETKRTAIRYPSTDTIVEIIVHKVSK